VEGQPPSPELLDGLEWQPGLLGRLTIATGVRQKVSMALFSRWPRGGLQGDGGKALKRL